MYNPESVFEVFNNHPFFRGGILPKPSETPEVIETADTYEVRIQIPSHFEKQDIRLEFLNQQLALFCTSYKFEQDSGHAFLAYKPCSRSHTKSFSFQVPIDADHIRAMFVDGILRVTLPKSGIPIIKKIIPIE